MANEANKRSPYHQFKPGETIGFDLKTLQSDGSIEIKPQQATIRKIAGGGFFGRVLLLKDQPYVIKTSVPDAWHDFWRRANWGLRDFPSQTNETAAQLDHLSMRIIHNVIPNATSGTFYAPDSFGYTQLPNGYAQAIEEVQGRIPRLDDGGIEFRQFRNQAQPELTDIGLRLGLEQAAQVHPNNRFGMANLWKDLDDDSRWIWMDTLPAIPHKGFVLPFFYFEFHRQVKDYFYHPQLRPKEPTFNRIHTGYLLTHLTNHPEQFSPQERTQLIKDLDLYQQLRNDYDRQNASERNIPGALNTLGETVKEVPGKVIGKVGRKIKSGGKLAFNPQYRNEIILEGMAEARDHNLVNEQEYQESTKTVTTKASRLATTGKVASLGGLIASYRGISTAQKVPELVVYNLIGEDLVQTLGQNGLSALTSFTENPERVLQLAAAFLVFRIAGGVAGILTTQAYEAITKQDYSAAKSVCWIPGGGDILALAAQSSVMAGNRDNRIWHYTVRKFISDLSSLHPSGGPGTQTEGDLWLLLGQRIENLTRKKA